MASPDYLFNEENLSEFLRNRGEAMRAEIDACQSDYLLKVSLDDLAQHLADRYTVEPVILSEQVEIAEHGETKIDVRNDPLRPMFDPSKPVSINATSATFVIAFEGCPEVFRYRPSQRSSLTPIGQVIPGELRVRLQRSDHDADAMRRDFQSIRESIQNHINWGAEEIKRFNADLHPQAKNRLEARRKKFLEDHGMVAALGFPIRQRGGEAASYTAPMTRKKIPISRPVTSPGVFKPEPILERQHYEHILEVISNMVLVMERSPASFAPLDEQGLRTHILVQLNGHYEGQATGETFNAEGKTDILIRVEGRNIFIAECKFWKGAAAFKAAIDQLLGYTAWRDTKTAIIVFNRNKDTSAVLEQIPALVKAHANYKRQIADYKNETGFRFVLHHKADKNKELLLTVSVFDVPA
jgi:hypothetical protein